MFTKVLLSFLLIIVLNFQAIELLAIKKQTASPIETVIEKLAEKVNSYQVLKAQNFTPPNKWAEKLGLFKTDIRLNFFGNAFSQSLRNGEASSVFDNDMFSTGWILTTLLESTLYGKGAPVFDPERLQLALDAIGAYNNKNDENAEKNLIRTFWPQNFNETTGFWYQQPININNVALELQKIPFDQIFIILEILGLKNWAVIMEDLKGFSEYSPIFHIPPDFDDTYLNLGLGSTLSKVSDIYPRAIASWLPNNTNVDHLIEVTAKYSYEPFNEDLNKNLIDPRTFFYARKFIQAAAENKESLKLITTW